MLYKVDIIVLSVSIDSKCHLYVTDYKEQFIFRRQNFD